MTYIDWSKLDLNSPQPEPDSAVEPALGPRPLFFSGGSALREVAACLALHTHRSRHIITTFDSGGSSAALRRHLNIAAVGDLRARISALALADTPERRLALDLWERRFAPELDAAALRHEFSALCTGEHPWVHGLGRDLSDSLLPLLREFQAGMPEAFDLRGACLGNLALAGAFLCFKSLGEAIAFCAELFQARGVICPVSEAKAHLAVRFASGRIMVGQHFFSAKEVTRQRDGLFKAEGPILEMWYVKSLESAAPISVPVSEKAAALIADADLICYPPGSFFSSLLANLLPDGVGRSIAANPCPKIYLPSPGLDPELLGYSFKEQLVLLLKTLRASLPAAEPANFLNAVLVDSRNGAYPGGIPYEWLTGQGIAVLDCELVDASLDGRGFLRADAGKVCAVFRALSEALAVSEAS